MISCSFLDTNLPHKTDTPAAVVPICFSVAGTNPNLELLPAIGNTQQPNSAKS